MCVSLIYQNHWCWKFLHRFIDNRFSQNIVHRYLERSEVRAYVGSDHDFI